MYHKTCSSVSNPLNLLVSHCSVLCSLDKRHVLKACLTGLTPQNLRSAPCVLNHMRVCSCVSVFAGCLLLCLSSGQRVDC